MRIISCSCAILLLTVAVASSLGEATVIPPSEQHHAAAEHGGSNTSTYEKMNNLLDSARSIQQQIADVNQEHFAKKSDIWKRQKNAYAEQTRIRNSFLEPPFWANALRCSSTAHQYTASFADQQQDTNHPMNLGYIPLDDDLLIDTYLSSIDCRIVRGPSRESTLQSIYLSIEKKEAITATNEELLEAEIAAVEGAAQLEEDQGEGDHPRFYFRVSLNFLKSVGGVSFPFRHVAYNSFVKYLPVVHANGHHHHDADDASSSSSFHTSIAERYFHVFGAGTQLSASRNYHNPNIASFLKAAGAEKKTKRFVPGSLFSLFSDAESTCALDSALLARETRMRVRSLVAAVCGKQGIAKNPFITADRSRTGECRIRQRLEKEKQQKQHELYVNELRKEAESEAARVAALFASTSQEQNDEM